MAVVIGEVKPGFLDGHPENGTIIPLPPQNGGAVGWGKVYASFAVDFHLPAVPKARLRIAVFNGGAWRIGEIALSSTDGRVPLTIQDGDQVLSVGRIKANEADLGNYPISYMIEAVLKA